MLCSGALADVTLSASGTTLRAHRLVLASCSQYFAQLFKEVEAESGALVVVLSCEPMELRLLLTFMYTGEVTASKRSLPALLRLAQALRVSGLTNADTNATLTPTDIEETKQDICEHPTSPINLELKPDSQGSYTNIDDFINPSRILDEIIPSNIESREPGFSLLDTSLSEIVTRREKERLSKLDQIVQNLYSTHKAVSPTTTVPVTPPAITNLTDADNSSPNSASDRKWRMHGAVCNVCNKILSNQYNLRVHMETHAGMRHACHSCSHVSRSRDALRKHVAYRHPNSIRGLRM